MGRMENIEKTFFKKLFLKKGYDQNCLQLKVMTKCTGIIEFIHLNPNKNIKAQRDVGGYGWSLAGEKKILR